MQGRLLWLGLGVVLAALVSVLDFATGSELSLGLLYVAAVGLAAWKAGRVAGLILAVVCAAGWFVVDRAGSAVHSQPSIDYWNALIRLGFLVASAILIAAFRRTRDREQAESRIDRVTGATNRRHFLDRIDEELERSSRYRRPLTLAYVDLDQFKQVNDHLGHAVGDQVLQVVARTLRERLRKTDTVARFGGDEFAILLPETGVEAAQAAIDAARAELLKSMSAHGWPVTFSIGVVTSSTGEIGVDAFIREADELMYRVKREGKNRVLHALAPAKAGGQNVRRAAGRAAKE